MSMTSADSQRYVTPTEPPRFMSWFSDSTMPAALLKVRGAPQWQIFVGDNYASYVEDFNSKGGGHVDIVLIAPTTIEGQEERVINRINPMKGLPTDDPWFAASTEEALSIFSAVYPPDVTRCASYDAELQPPSAAPQDVAAFQRKLATMRDTYNLAVETQSPLLSKIVRQADQLFSQAVHLPLDDAATMEALTAAYNLSRETRSAMFCIIRDRIDMMIQRTLAREA